METQFFNPPGVDHFGQNNQIFDNRIYNQMQGQNQQANKFDNGFQLSGAEAGRVIRPSDNSPEFSKNYDKAVSDVTKYDHTNVSEAVKEAAAKGGGVFLMEISKDTKDSEKLLKEMKELKEKDPSLTIVALDKDKIMADPNAKEWQNFIQKDNLAHSTLKSVKAGAEGEPVLGNTVSTHWGGDIKAGVIDQNPYAKRATSSQHFDASVFEQKNTGHQYTGLEQSPVSKKIQPLLPELDDLLEQLEKDPTARQNKPLSELFPYSSKKWSKR